jgi:peptidoglycan/LPS O-acetylase OafA/YrhL
MSTSAGIGPMRYRADIDGLRAVAVLVVLGFHAFPEWMPGGFVGVDVFFVISGFLISGIILEGLQDGSFRFTNFYGRRIRRIFPALALVLGACAMAGWFVLLEDEYAQVGKHLVAGAAFVSNLALWKESGYFDFAAQFKPLLHLWSLGIEEQFYLVWPLLLYLAFRTGLSHLALIATICLLSFALNLHHVVSDSVQAYYSPTTRFWELSLGGLLACLTLRGWAPPAQARDMLTLLGIALVSGTVALAQSDWLFPGWLALVPTLGTFLMIAAGADAWLNRAVLARPLLVWLGLISFPLYLWHWPLLSYARIIEGTTPAAATRLALVLASVPLAWLTYRCLEKPCRQGSHGGWKVALLSLAMTLVGGLGYLVYAGNGLPARIAQDRQGNSQDERRWDRRFHGMAGVTSCAELLKPVRDSFCASTAPQPTVAILGDSHAAHLFWGFAYAGDARFNKVITLGAGSCPPLLDTETRIGCVTALRIALDQLDRLPSIRHVVLGAYYGYVEDARPDQVGPMVENYLKTFARLHASGKQVTFVIDPPALKTDPESCIRRRPFEAAFPSRFGPPDFCDGATPSDLRRRARYDDFVRTLAGRASGVNFYDPANILCTGDTCKLFEREKLLYGDWNHLSIYGSEFVVQDMLKRLARAPAANL